MKLQKKQAAEFRRRIFSWWHIHKRDLLWRQTHDPYRILVSEIMLQQTQVHRVVLKYAEFINAYPTVRALSRARSADILRIWQGMGYNRRALYLKQSADIIVRKYHGKIPQEEKALLHLPGIGIYTARAILVFAYRRDIALVDTNIRKIITHFFFHDKKQKEEDIEDVAGQLVPPHKSWEWHQALMDYGALKLKTLKLKIKTSQTKIQPFQESNRFYRGRIMDLLRERSYRCQNLMNIVHKTYNKDDMYIHSVINSLKKDRLVAIKGSCISLPE